MGEAGDITKQLHCQKKLKLIFDPLYCPTNVSPPHQVVTVLLGDGLSCKKYILGTGLKTIWKCSECKINSCLSNKLILLEFSYKTAMSVPINIAYETSVPWKRNRHCFLTSFWPRLASHSFHISHTLHWGHMSCH